jgi:hypothetical protein
MSFHINFFVVLIASILIAVLGQYSGGDCTVDAEPAQDCFQYIPPSCMNGTFTVDRLSYGSNCSNVSLFWGGPMYNLTVLFQSHLLDPYEVCISQVMCAKAFRTTNSGREVPVEWNPTSGEPVCFASPRGGRPTMKFRFDAGNRYHCYGTFINFFYKL